MTNPTGQPQIWERPVWGPKGYYGRGLLIRSLLKGLDQNRQFALCAGPRLGKTSTLHQLAYTLKQRWKRDPEQTKVVPVIFDLKPINFKDKRAWMNALWQAITTSVLQPGVHGEATPPRVSKLELHKTADPWSALLAACEKFWQDMRGSKAWCFYVLLIDDGDRLFTREGEAVLNNLADLFARQQDWSPAGVVVTGGRALREHLYDRYGKLKGLRPIFLGTLKEDDAGALVRDRLPDIADLQVRELIRFSGRHPYVLQRLVQNLVQRGAVDDLDAACDQVLAEIEPLFAEIWQQFDMGRGVTYRGAYAAPEHALMQLLIDYASPVEINAAEKDLGLKPLREYAEFLDYCGVIERAVVHDSNRLRAHFETWNAWYNQRILT